MAEKTSEARNNLLDMFGETLYRQLYDIVEDNQRMGKMPDMTVIGQVGEWAGRYVGRSPGVVIYLRLTRR